MMSNYTQYVVVKIMGKTTLRTYNNYKIKMTKFEQVETHYKKDFNKYYRAMNYRILSVEIDAL